MLQKGTLDSVTVVGELNFYQLRSRNGNDVSRDERLFAF